MAGCDGAGVEAVSGARAAGEECPKGGGEAGYCGLSCGGCGADVVGG